MKQPRETKVKVFTVMTPSLIQRLERVAERQTMSRSLLIRMACEKWLKDFEQGNEAA